MIHVCSLARLHDTVAETGASHIVTLLRLIDRVQRPTRIPEANHLILGMDDITVKRIGPDGAVLGQIRLLGQFTRLVYMEQAERTPVLRRKLRAVAQRFGITSSKATRLAAAASDHAKGVIQSTALEMLVGLSGSGAEQALYVDFAAHDRGRFTGPGGAERLLAVHRRRVARRQVRTAIDCGTVVAAVTFLAEPRNASLEQGRLGGPVRNVAVGAIVNDRAVLPKEGTALLGVARVAGLVGDRKSTRLNSSHT